MNCSVTSVAAAETAMAAGSRRWLPNHVQASSPSAATTMIAVPIWPCSGESAKSSGRARNSRKASARKASALTVIAAATARSRRPAASLASSRDTSVRATSTASGGSTGRM